MVCVLIADFNDKKNINCSKIHNVINNLNIKKCIFFIYSVKKFNVYDIFF
jgi:hypothetical protein